MADVSRGDALSREPGRSFDLRIETVRIARL